MKKYAVGDHVLFGATRRPAKVVRTWRPWYAFKLYRLYAIEFDNGGLKAGNNRFVCMAGNLRPVENVTTQL